MAYGARLESVLGESPQGFESPILRRVTSHDIVEIQSGVEVLLGGRDSGLRCLDQQSRPKPLSRESASSTFHCPHDFGP